MDIKTVLLTANKAITDGKYADFLLDCTDYIKWDFVGDRILEGKSAILQYMKETYLEPPISNIERLNVSEMFLTVTGEISLKNKNGDYDEYYYCDNWEFEDGKMANLKAYVIKKEISSFLETINRQQ